MQAEVIAYHEAGHMVAAWELGLTVLEATIVPDEEHGYLGRVKVPFEDRVRYAMFADEEYYLYAHLVGLFAGMAAGERHGGVEAAQTEAALGRFDGDYNNAAYFILSLAGADADVQKETELSAKRYAQRLIHNRWEAVEAVARVLMDRETLDAMECRRVLWELAE
jgi:ATP-dependent Zn protease